MTKTTHGGPGRGQGRKPISKSGELMKARPVRMTDEDWEKCKLLGGASWVRSKIKSARLAYHHD
jgi:hypothetical protein